MKNRFHSRSVRFVAVFIASAIFFAVMGVAYLQNKMELDQTRMSQLVSAKAATVHDVLTKLLYKANSLAALVVQSDGDVENFEKTAATVIDDPSIKNVMLAPNNIVSDVYPLIGNEAVVGLDFSDTGAGNIEAQQAIERGEMVLGGPFDLVQGGQAIVGRQPVYINIDGNRSYWGLVSVTLDYPSVLSGAELSQLEMQGLAYQIWRISPETGERQVIASSEYLHNPEANFVEQPLNILNAEWFFRLSPVKMWYEYAETWIIIALALFVSWLIAFLVIHNHDLRKVKIELERLSTMDPLTGTLNRRGVFSAITNLIDMNSSGFLVCYIDLNRFKLINDLYGHAVGDEVLQRFVRTVSRLIDEDIVFGRIGGDEFILMYKTVVAEAGIKIFFEELERRLEKNGVAPDGGDVDISFSWGTAQYPQDGDTADLLVGAADLKMYVSKTGSISGHKHIARQEDR